MIRASSRVYAPPAMRLRRGPLHRRIAASVRMSCARRLRRGLRQDRFRRPRAAVDPRTLAASRSPVRRPCSSAPAAASSARAAPAAEGPPCRTPRRPRPPPTSTTAEPADERQRQPHRERRQSRPTSSAPALPDVGTASQRRLASQSAEVDRVVLRAVTGAAPIAGAGVPGRLISGWLGVGLNSTQPTVGKYTSGHVNALRSVRL